MCKNLQSITSIHCIMMHIMIGEYVLLSLQDCRWMCSRGSVSVQLRRCNWVRQQLIQQLTILEVSSLLFNFDDGRHQCKEV